MDIMRRSNNRQGLRHTCSFLTLLCGSIALYYFSSLISVTFLWIGLKASNRLKRKLRQPIILPHAATVIRLFQDAHVLSTSNAFLEHAERGMSQLIIPKEILWNPIISARISRYLSRKDRLNCKNLIPTWDRLATRILALTPESLSRKTQLITLLQDATQGVEIFTLDFASHRGKNVIQFLSILSEPGSTGLFNLTTLDIMKQPISIEQLRELLVNYPMPRLRILSLSIVVWNARPIVTECLKCELRLEEVAIRFFGGLSPKEKLLLMQSFGNLRSMSLDDSSDRRYRLPCQRRDWDHSQVWIPQWTSLQIHHDSELLDLFLGEGKISTGLPELTLLTEPGHFFPKRYITKASVVPRTIKYRTLKKPQLHIAQFCRACVRASDKRDMPRLQCPLTDAILDDEAPLNLVACSVMSVEDNRVLHPLNLHDLYVHIGPPRTSSSATLPNASTSSTISTNRRQAPARGMVEALIERRCSEIRRLSIRVCKPTSDECRSKYIRELPLLAKDYFLPIIEKCGSNLQFLEVSAELITACCSNVLTTRRLRRLQDKCLNVRKATVIASDDVVFEQQLRPSAKNISTYLNLFPALKTVRIIAMDIFHDRTIQEILANCRHLRRLYIFSQNSPTFECAPLPSHDALELLFLELNGLSGEDRCEKLLNETLSTLHSPKYILLKIEHGKYPRVKTLKAFFANRAELRWLVVVFNKYGKVILCHADADRRGNPEIFKDPTFHLGTLIYTYPELYTIFWSEFQKFSNCALY